MSEVKLQAVRGHKYTCATVQGNSTYENRCDCGALDSAGSAIPDHSWEMAHLQRQLSEAVERAEKAEGRAKDFEEQAAICAKVTEGAEAEVARLREALTTVRGHFHVEHGAGRIPSIGYDSQALLKVIQTLDAALQGEPE